jgi:hypothetical protein
MFGLIGASKYALRTTIITIALVIAGIGNLARGADGVVSWTHPTQYTDNTPIPAGGLSGTEIQYGKCNATRTGLLATPAPVTVSVPFPATTRTITGLTNAEWCFAARSTQPVGSPSDWTGFAWKLIDLQPKPPVLSSTITTAYETWKFLGKTYLGRSVGSIPLGVECGAAVVQTSTAVYHEIPSSAVTFNKTPRPGPLVTRCAAA